MWRFPGNVRLWRRGGSPVWSKGGAFEIRCKCSVTLLRGRVIYYAKHIAVWLWIMIVSKMIRVESKKNTWRNADGNARRAIAQVVPCRQKKKKKIWINHAEKSWVYRTAAINSQWRCLKKIRIMTESVNIDRWFG